MCPPRNSCASRSALTVVETLMAIVIMGLVAVALGGLSSAVESGSTYTFGHAAAMQQAQVALLRIQHRIATATATAEFPGVQVFHQEIEGWDFPDTLVVWSPQGGAAHPQGPPLFSELVIYCPDPAAPHRLLEIRAAHDDRLTPPVSDRARWLIELAALKADPLSQRSVLIETLRTAQFDSTGQRRGVVRFAARLRPSAAAWAAYQSGAVAWTDLPWAQDVRGARWGQRQSLCQIELQLHADEPGRAVSSEVVIPFFGSAALYYSLPRGSSG